MAELLKFSVPVEIQAAKGEGKRPTFSMVAYTGVPMNAGGFFSPIIVELSGVKTVNKEIPIFLDHDPSRIVGQGQATVGGESITVDGSVMGEDADAQKVTTLAKNGFKWQASIGASVTRREFLEAGKKATVNGREVNGPMIIARESVLQEVSFVAIGADQQTSAAVAASHSTEKGKDMNFEAWLTAKGIDPTKLEDGAVKATLKASFDAEQKVTTPAPVATPVQAGANGTGGTQVQTSGQLGEIAAKRKAENKRVAEITTMADLEMEKYPHQTEEIEINAAKAIEDGLSVAEFELIQLRARRPQTGGRRGMRTSSEHVSEKVLEAALCRSTGVKDFEKDFDDQTLQAAHTKYRDGLSLKTLILEAANRNGAGLSGISGNSTLREALRAALPPVELRASSGFSTLSLPNILANVQNKFLRESFMAVEDTWRRISSIQPVNDFKAISRMSLTGDLQYEQISATGEIPHGTLSERAYSNQAKTYGKMLAITREHIINDDLSAFAQVPRRLGRGAALKINDVFWTEFLANSSFFTTGNSNYDDGTDTALDTAGMTKALGTFWYAQTDPDGKPLGAEPVILLVPPGQYIPALILNGSTAMNPAGQTATTALVGNLNPFAGKFRVEKSTYLANSSYTGYSALAWYLLCDPSDIPVIEVCFLGGREMPIVETTEADFDQLGIKIRAYHDFGVTKQEFRGGMKFKGEA